MYIEGGREVGGKEAFFGSNRLKSAEEPFVGLSASIVSRATDVEAIDFRGHVPYQELFDLICSERSARNLESCTSGGGELDD
jgi:hypothetical protein